MGGNSKDILKIIFGILGGIAALTTIISSFTLVPVGFVGIKKYLGQVQHEETFEEGLSLKMPFFVTVEDYTKKIISVDVDASASSKDLQDVGTTVTIQMSFMFDHSHILQKIGSYGRFVDAILVPAIQESVKASSALYTAEELITKRAEVKNHIILKVSDYLETTLIQKDLDKNVVNIANLAITDFSFSEEFNKSIELKVRAEQEALQAVNEKRRKITDAEATAEQIRVESIAKANAIEREGRALQRFPMLIQLKQLEKWNGVLPSVTGSYIPMLDIKSKTGG